MANDKKDVEKDALEAAGLDALAALSIPEKEREPTAEEAKAIFEAKVAQRMQVLHRGALNDKLDALVKMYTPPGRKGQFIRMTDTDQIRYANLGYTFDTLPGQGLHARGDGKIVVGDVVLMTVSDLDSAVNKEVRKRRVKWTVDGPKKEFMNNAQAEGTIPINESNTQILTGG